MKKVNDLGTYYEMPLALLNEKYHGCGNGKIVVQKLSGVVYDMDYLDENDCPMDDQNIAMHPDAGEVLEETHNFVVYRANFSCGSACLF